MECKVTMACTKKLTFYGTQSYDATTHKLPCYGVWYALGGKYTTQLKKHKVNMLWSAELPWHAIGNYHVMKHKGAMLWSGKLQWHTLGSYHAMKHKIPMLWSTKLPSHARVSYHYVKHKVTMLNTKKVAIQGFVLTYYINSIIFFTCIHPFNNFSCIINS